MEVFCGPQHSPVSLFYRLSLREVGLFPLGHTAIETRTASTPKSWSEGVSVCGWLSVPLYQGLSWWSGNPLDGSEMFLGGAEPESLG